MKKNQIFKFITLWGIGLAVTSTAMAVTADSVERKNLPIDKI